MPVYRIALTREPKRSFFDIISYLVYIHHHAYATHIGATRSATYDEREWSKPFVNLRNATDLILTGGQAGPVAS